MIKDKRTEAFLFLLSLSLSLPFFHSLTTVLFFLAARASFFPSDLSRLYL